MTLYMLQVETYNPIAGGPILNMFGYKSNVLIVGETGLFLDAVEAELLPKVAAIQHAGCYILRASAIDTGNPANFEDRVYTVADFPGLRAGEILPAYFAAKFHLIRSVRGKRSGYKRFSCVSETDISSGNPTAGYTTVCDTLATQLKAPLHVGLVESWFPVILERPANIALPWGFHDFSRALFAGFTTQNTRKR